MSTLRAKLRYLIPLAAFVLLLVVLGIGLLHAPKKGILPSPLIGKSAPQFTLPSLFDGQGPVSSGQLRGHWTLVNVWGSWCVACRVEHQTLLMIKQQSVIPIIGIDWNDDATDAREWLAQLGNPYSAVGVDPGGRTAIDWGVYAAPESFLVSPSGTVMYKQVGVITPEVWQHELLPRIQGIVTTGATGS